MNDTQSLKTTVESKHIDLAVAGWLDEHSKSVKTLHAYADTINQFRGELRRIGQDLDSDIRTLAVVLSSFYTYALERYLVAPMDDAGHILNPIKLVKRKKIEPYQGIHWLEPEEAEAALRTIDRSTLLGKRDYALLAILLQTGRRLKEVASLEWQHVRMKGQRLSLTFEHCKGDKTMRDTLNLANSKALLTWLHGYYGKDLNRQDQHAPLWVTLSRNTQQRGQPLGIQGIKQVCQKYLQTHTHVTRHTFPQLMIKAGAPLPEIQARVGHESLATTGIYARVFNSDENPHADKLATLLGVE